MPVEGNAEAMQVSKFNLYKRSAKNDHLLLQKFQNKHFGQCSMALHTAQGLSTSTKQHSRLNRITYKMKLCT